ncbi:MAG: hypothetical protein GY858_00230 [Candidatus Omnitrophica bacterium]|nr:hypothetical protein [Candidatus Omnitrophota bacterium]
MNIKDKKILMITTACITAAIVLVLIVALSKIVGKRYRQRVPSETSPKMEYHNYFDKGTYDINDTLVSQEQRSSKSIVLQSIATLPDPIAIFNGREYAVGDQIGPYKIVDIREEEVILDNKSDIYYLKMGQSLDNRK